MLEYSNHHNVQWPLVRYTQDRGAWTQRHDYSIVNVVSHNFIEGSTLTKSDCMARGALLGYYFMHTCFFGTRWSLRTVHTLFTVFLIMFVQSLFLVESHVELLSQFWLSFGKADLMSVLYFLKTCSKASVHVVCSVVLSNKTQALPNTQRCFTHSYTIHERRSSLPPEKMRPHERRGWRPKRMKSRETCDVNERLGRQERQQQETKETSRLLLFTFIHQRT